MTHLIESIFAISHDVSCVVPQRRKNKVYLHALSEIGELGEEAIIHSGESYKSSGPDGVVGEAADVLNCISDLLWLAAHEMDRDYANEWLSQLALLSSFKTLEEVKIIPFREAMIAFEKQTSRLFCLYSLTENDGNANAKNPWVAQEVINLIDAVIGLAKASNPSLTTEDFLDILEVKCRKWKAKAAPSKSAPKQEAAAEDTKVPTFDNLDTMNNDGNWVREADYLALKSQLELARSNAMPDVDTLSNIIRTVDGNHDLGAGLLAEAIIHKLQTQSQNA